MVRLSFHLRPTERANRIRAPPKTKDRPTEALHSSEPESVQPTRAPGSYLHLKGNLLTPLVSSACCSTSAKAGSSTLVGPSATVALGSSRVLAKALCAVTLSRHVQRLCQPCPAARLSSGGALRTLSLTSCRRKFQLSLLHRPPTSKASTTRVAAPPCRSSGYTLSFRRHALCRTTPFSSAAPA